MVQLVPMTEEEFEAFMKISMRDQAQGQVQAGVWRPEEADKNIQMLRSQFLPAGLATPNHFFFTSTGSRHKCPSGRPLVCGGRGRGETPVLCRGYTGP